MFKKLNLQNLVFIALAVYLTVLLIGQQDTLTRNMEQYHELQQKIAAEELRKEELLREESMVGTDEYIEKKAREELGYVKNNEIVFIND